MRLHFIDNFLSKRECDFFCNYHHKHYLKQIYLDGNPYIHDQTFPFAFDLNPNSKYHIRVQLLRKKIMRKILKLEPSLKFNYDQIVSWPTGSYQNFHFDTIRNDWSSICYLNDDYAGGATLLRDVPTPGDHMCEPKQGKVLLFPSKIIKHAVSPVEGTRFTYIAWWRQRN